MCVEGIYVNNCMFLLLKSKQKCISVHFGFLENLNIRAHHTRQSGWLFRPDSSKIALFPFKVLVALWTSLWKSVFFPSFNHTFSSIYMYKEFPCSWNLTYPWFGIQNFISNFVDGIFFKIIEQHICFVKGRGTCCRGERNI